MDFQEYEGIENRRVLTVLFGYLSRCDHLLLCVQTSNPNSGCLKLKLVALAPQTEPSCEVINQWSSIYLSDQGSFRR